MDNSRLNIVDGHDVLTYTIDKNGVVMNKEGKTLRWYLSRDKYWFVQLYCNGKWRRRSVHRLVYNTFNGILGKGYRLTFKDGNKDNVSYDNIEKF